MLEALSQEADWRATICRSLLLVAYWTSPRKNSRSALRPRTWSFDQPSEARRQLFTGRPGLNWLIPGLSGTSTTTG